MFANLAAKNRIPQSMRGRCQQPLHCARETLAAVRSFGLFEERLAFHALSRD